MQIPSISFLIPVYNEGDSIRETLRNLRHVADDLGISYEVIVIDDGSTDNMPAFQKEDGIILIRHPNNRGYGRALKSGILRASHDWCAIVDADGSYPVERFADLLKFIPQFDMVVGARTGKNFWGSWLKRINRHILHAMVEFVVGQRIPDVNSGMRIFKRSIAITHFNRICSGFSFTTTLTLAMLLDEHFVKYVPIEYHPRVGKSKVKMGVDSLRMLQILVQSTLYYNPLKIFLLMCVLNFVVGVFFTLLLVFMGTAQEAALCLGFFTSISIAIGAIGFISESYRLSRT